MNCNTAIVVGQRHVARERESGAIAMLLAILVGTGALFAVTALAIDAGRQFLTHNQVQQAAESNVQAVLSKCQHKGCPSQSVMTSMINTTLANSTARLLQACWDTGTSSETCINGSGTSVARDSAVLSACPTLKNYSGSPVAVAGTDPYFQIVVQTRSPLASMFNPGPAKHFRACGQGIWWIGAVNYDVPKVMLIPACQFGAVDTDHYLYESPGQGNLDLNSCGTIDFGNGFSLTSSSNWLNEIGRMTADGSNCSGTDSLNLNGEPAAGNRITKNGYCTVAQVRAFFNPPSPGVNPRMFGLAGQVVSGNAYIVAFASFTLVKLYDGDTNKWLLPDGSVTTSPPNNPGGSCSGSSGKLCLYGHFSAAVAAGHGVTSTSGYAVRP